jgi:hypothetical protein
LCGELVALLLKSEWHVSPFADCIWRIASRSG